MKPIKKSITLTHLHIKEAINCDLYYQYSTSKYMLSFIKKDAAFYMLKQWYSSYFHIGKQELEKCLHYSSNEVYQKITPKIIDTATDEEAKRVEILYEHFGFPIAVMKNQESFKKCYSQHVTIIIRKIVGFLLQTSIVHGSISPHSILYDGNACAVKLINMYNLTDVASPGTSIIYTDTYSAHELSNLGLCPTISSDIYSLGITIALLNYSNGKVCSKKCLSNTSVDDIIKVVSCCSKDLYATRIYRILPLMMSENSYDRIKPCDILSTLPYLLYSKILINEFVPSFTNSLLALKNEAINKIMDAQFVSKNVAIVSGMLNGLAKHIVIRKYANSDQMMNVKILSDSSTKCDEPSLFICPTHFNIEDTCTIMKHQGMSLLEYVQEQPKNKSLFIFIVNALYKILEFLNSNHIFYGSFNPYHILVSPDKEISLISYQHSKIIEGITEETIVNEIISNQSVLYSPPEIIKLMNNHLSEKEQLKYIKIDLYMLSKTFIIALFSLRTPEQIYKFFYNCTNYSSKLDILNTLIPNHHYFKEHIVDIPQFKDVSSEHHSTLIMLLSQMMEYFPNKRPCVEHIMKTLKSIQTDKEDETYKWPCKTDLVYLVNVNKSNQTAKICKFNIAERNNLVYQNGINFVESNISNIGCNCEFINAFNKDVLKLYAYGGSKASTALKDIYLYNESSFTFSSIAQLKEGRANCGIALGLDLIIFIGGQRMLNNEYTYSDTIELLDLSANSTAIHKYHMKEKKINCGACLMRNKQLLIIGGETNLFSISFNQNMCPFSEYVEIINIITANAQCFKCSQISEQYSSFSRVTCYEEDNSNIIIFGGEYNSHHSYDNITLALTAIIKFNLCSITFTSMRGEHIEYQSIYDAKYTIPFQKYAILAPSFIANSNDPQFILQIINKNPTQFYNIL